MGDLALKHALCVAATMLLLCVPGRGIAAPTEVGGGGGKATDCLTTFIAEVNLPAANPRHVRCVDGDPACDADLMINGVCTIPLTVCVNSTFSPSCSLNGVESIVVDHSNDLVLDSKFDPDLQSLQASIDNVLLDDPPNLTADDCTAATNVRVRIHGPLGSNNKCRRSKAKKVRITTLSQVVSGRVYKDVDVIKVQCDPNPAAVGCDPQSLFDGTFDRINKQVFEHSCALGGCHNSNFQAGGLLLEATASYDNLVEIDPLNGSADNDGWKRVDVTVADVSGSPSNSYLMRKIENSSTYPLPSASYGERMPLRTKPNGAYAPGPKLHPYLREIIELWITNGAPENGWVAGTF